MIKNTTITSATKRKVSLYLLAAVYIIAGINHFLSFATYNKIMPSFIPYPYATIYITGIVECVLGILLLFNTSRRFAAWGIITLLLAIFPANIQMLMNYLDEHDSRLWIAILRLPLQVPLIYWAWTFTRDGKKEKAKVASVASDNSLTKN